MCAVLTERSVLSHPRAFTNNDSATHTVTSGANRTKDGKFDREISGSTEDSITFDTAGTFEYFCNIHSSMKGTVVVK
ncbi:MAG: hypothetical protein E6J52_12290 [Chloroflexi bacterium]|nr:MAG: hypothetical protein E6J52_12290 [Chloroflexota bacterium]